MTSILAILITLGIVIFFHELGHFLVAKWVGVKVETFCLGFGPKIFGFKYHETEYKISILPFGGYVKIAGEYPDQEKTGAPDEFFSKPPFERIKIVAAGPAFNLLIAVPLYILVALIGFSVPVVPNIVGEVREGSLAKLAGIKIKDEIVALEEEKVSNWYEFLEAVEKNPSKELKLTILRDGVEMRIEIKSEKEIKADDLGLDSLVPAEIGSLRGGFPAKEAGLLKGDLITYIDSEPILRWDDMVRIIHQSPEKELKMGIKRGEEEFFLNITPAANELPTADGKIEKVGLIGISPKTETERLGLYQAVTGGFLQTYATIKLNLFVLQKLLTAQISFKNVAGPVGISQMASEQAKEGLGGFLAFVAFLSVGLGILNLLPIPIVDGGSILLFVIEKIRGKMVSLKTQKALHYVGIVFLLSLAVLATSNDFSRISKTKAFKEKKEQVIEWIGR